MAVGNVRILQQVVAHNFASFADITVKFADLTVLVGPNGAGKSNLLKLFRFLGETARTDLGPAVAAFGGLDSLLFRGTRRDEKVRINVQARITKYSSLAAPDEYSLEFSARRGARRSEYFVLSRSESFVFKRTQGQGRRITLSGTVVSVEQEGGIRTRAAEVQAQSSGLSILRRLNKDVDASQVEELAELFETLRIFDVNVPATRQPSARASSEKLLADGSNLAPHLAYLSIEFPDLFARIVDDMRQVLPG